MENSNNRKSLEKNNKNKDAFSRIITVQFLACAFIICLIAIVFKLGIANDFKEKYMHLLSEDISVSEVISSAKNVADSVMKPISESRTVEIVESKSISEEENISESKEKEVSTKDNRTVAQVMSMFSDSESITPPAHGTVSSLFGYRTDPISGSYKLHSAVDIAVNEGTKVSAAWDGIVTNCGYDNTAGNFVWMVHKNGCETLYCHCSEILVKTGDVIRAGEVVALSGNTGYSTGPHLHFGIKKDGEMVDPLNYLPVKNNII